MYFFFPLSRLTVNETVKEPQSVRGIIISYILQLKTLHYDFLSPYSGERISLRHYGLF